MKIAVLSLPLFLPQSNAHILRVLATAHGKGIMHWDILPKNIVVSIAPDGSKTRAFIDWGLGRQGGEDCAECGILTFAELPTF